MSSVSKIAPYGSWRSPIAAARIADDTIGFGEIALDDGAIYWGETRPLEGGRNAIVRRRHDSTEDVLPQPFSARTRVHEYGGGAFAVSDGVIYFSNHSDQRLYCLTQTGDPGAITPATGTRYADAVIDRGRQRLICVREEHCAGQEPVNTLVAVDLTGRAALRTLVSGNDFFASPRLSPDGTRLAWLTWNHPNMPWDGTQLWQARIAEDGSLEHPEKIAGGEDESIFQPEFSPDGVLYFISDRSGWGNLYRCGQQGGIEAMAPMQAEFGLPQWVFGLSTYAFESAQRLVCAYRRDGAWRMGVLDIDSRRLNPIATPFTEIHSVRASAGKLYFVGGSPTQASALVQLDLLTQRYEVLRRSNAIDLDFRYVSAPQPLEYPTTDSERAYAFYYPPVNGEHGAPQNEKAPLLVLSHGGPTSAASSSLNLRIQYWTSRGIAVLDVNYRGSTGYGRDYRRRLNGQWGVADVADCVAAARYLIERGLVDEKRIAIRGSSAGGYTTLRALTLHPSFHAGAVYYGVSDLEALAQDTHKFESHYLDRLVGPYPACRDLYRQRSPIHDVDRLACPVIFFQGLDDKVVPPDQTEKMVQALRVKGIPVAYVPFAGEAHGFRRAESIKRALEAELYFYSQIFHFTPADTLTPMTIENL